MPDKNAQVLAGKVAVITGSGGGIGRAIAEAMVREGAAVTIVDINGDNAAKVAAQIQETGGRALAVTCDVGDRAQVRETLRRTVAEFGSLDILVNNAHDLREVKTTLLDTDDEHLLRSLRSGLFGTFYFMQESYPHLKNTAGAVVNIGSAAGVRGLASYYSYAVTKEAIRATTRAGANEWGPDGIRVNTICPAAYDTPSMSHWKTKSEEELAQAASFNPLRRLGTADDIASVAVFLAGPAAGYITGHTLMVDGGSTIDAGR
ncbi:SDR family NAD(P)-dependent oxidoreductase [Kineosporia babensis]|uniref:Glucose 1-dehydrogenase n=1 Tax=Kineosporia babensis TaxID=499548 RepID=A0A9X1SW79_9ACTN|nr:glucose 1-dehydrogenase [Kineosporia babensis]MCD5314471.1 glucose 1-dehydrogenase [Kineosporia babensis]